jgi:TonB family protein
MKSTRKKLWRHPHKYLLLSLLLHFLLFVGIMLNHVMAPPVPTGPPDLVEVTIEPPPDQTSLTPQKPTPKKRLPQQVVEQNDKRVNDEHTDTRFLSKYDQVVKKQTRAKEVGAFTNTAEKAESQMGTQTGQKKHSLAREQDQRHGDMPKLRDLTPQFSVTPQSNRELAQNPGRPSQTDDYIKDIDVGMQTMLSTREFVFYSYYQRIKDQLRQNWEPTVREKVRILYRKGRTIASSRDRITQVMITLTPAGVLQRIDVLGQSGVQDLDDAAVEAFRKSAPFPNPPKGIVDADGWIRIRWDFVLEA